jgi:hypothetical protein
MVWMMPLDLVAEVSLPRRLPGQLEGVAQDAVDAVTGKSRLLDRHFPLGAIEQPAADLGILPLGILAHHDKVDVFGLPRRRAASGCRAAAGPASG